MITLRNLENVELIRAILAFTWTDVVLLHSTLIPNLKSRMFKAKNALRNMWNLISIVHHSKSVWNEGSHKLGKFIIAYSGLTHSIKLIHIFVNILNVSCGHYSQRTTQTVTSYHYFCRSVEGQQTVQIGFDLRFNTVEALIETNVNGATTAERVVCANCFQIQDPV